MVARQKGPLAMLSGLLLSVLTWVTWGTPEPPQPTPPSPPKPAAEATLSVGDARHLLGRAGFGGSLEEIRHFEKLTRAQAVDQLLETCRTEAQTPAPKWAREPQRSKPRSQMTPEERKQLLRDRRRMNADLKKWWYREMLETSSPLTERMTLFWHNHFTSSLRKVKQPVLIYRQNVLLRKHALGNFREVTKAIARDPAMMIYLDTVSNNKSKPNENFARELLELFTMGEGNYTEADVKEAARAFTGWKVNRRTGEYRFARARHDFGPKKFLGRSGRFNGDQIVDVIFEQPQTATYITTKLWTAFINEAPDAAEVARLAQVFRGASYEMKPLLRALLLSDHFWKPENRGRLVKSPVDLIVGASRSLGMSLSAPDNTLRVARSLQQDLFNPPNVKGWPGGPTWITATTLLRREQLLRSVGISRSERRSSRGPSSGDSSPDAMEPDTMNPAPSSRPKTQNKGPSSAAEWYQSLGSEPAVRARRAAEILLPLPPTEALVESKNPLTALRQILLDPTFQLK